MNTASPGLGEAALLLLIDFADKIFQISLVKFVFKLQFLLMPGAAVVIYCALDANVTVRKRLKCNVVTPISLFQLGRAAQGLIKVQEVPGKNAESFNAYIQYSGGSKIIVDIKDN